MEKYAAADGCSTNEARMKQGRTKSEQRETTRMCVKRTELPFKSVLGCLM